MTLLPFVLLAAKYTINTMQTIIAKKRITWFLRKSLEAITRRVVIGSGTFISLNVEVIWGTT